MLKKIGRMAAAAALLFLAGASFAQDVNRIDVNLGVTGILPKQTSGNGILQKPTKSGAFLFSARWRFNAKNSVAVNYARGSDSQIYANPFTFRIQTHVTEFTGAYVFSPIQTAKFEPFVFAGAGIVSFNPFNTVVQTVQVSVPSVQQTEPAFLYGGGVDYKIFTGVPYMRGFPVASHLALRLQYRGLFYKAPNFKNPQLFTGGQGHMAEAAAGIVLKF